jgi:hypothetical protein
MYDVGLHNLLLIPVITIFMSRGWSGNVARISQKKSTYGYFMRKPEGRRLAGRQRIIKLMLANGARLVYE